MFKIAFFSSSEFTIPILESIISNQGETLSQVAKKQFKKVEKKLSLLPNQFKSSLLNKEILDNEIVLSFVTTQPDRINRGKVFKNPISQFASSRKISLYQPESINNDLEKFQSNSIDIAVVASFGQILNKKVLETPKYGIVNWHPSLLPKYRGATPMQTAIKNGDSQTGLSWIKMGKGMDDGNIWIQNQTQLNGKSIKKLSTELASFGADTWALVIALQVLESENLLKYGSSIQKEEKAIPCYMIERKDALVYPSKQTAPEIRNHFLAYSQYPGTKFYCNYFGQQVKITTIGDTMSQETFSNQLSDSKILSHLENDSFWIQIQVGKIRKTFVKATSGFLEIREIMLKNGKRINLSGFEF